MFYDNCWTRACERTLLFCLQDKMCLWYLPVGCFNISYNVLQDSATYADMSSVSNKKQKQGDEEGEGGIWTVCVVVHVMMCQY